MAKLDILKFGHPSLTTPALPIDKIDEAVVCLAMDMIETMRSAPGIGLAANQIGVGKRLITVDPSIGEDPESLVVLINPEIISEEGEVISEEGCLSVPDVQEKVARPSKIRIKGLDLEGRPVELDAQDLLARIFCHEVDHLNGKLFLEHLSLLKRKLIKKKLTKNLDRERSS